MPERGERGHFRWSWVTFLVMGCSWWVSAGPPCCAPWIFLANGAWSTRSCYRDSCTAFPILSQTASVIIISPVPIDVVWAPMKRGRRCGTQASHAWGDRWLLVRAWKGTLAVITTSGFGTISPSIFLKADGTKRCEVAVKGITVSCCYCCLPPWIRSEWAKYPSVLCSILQVFSNKFFNPFLNV